MKSVGMNNECMRFNVPREQQRQQEKPKSLLKNLQVVFVQHFFC